MNDNKAQFAGYVIAKAQLVAHCGQKKKVIQDLVLLMFVVFIYRRSYIVHAGLLHHKFPTGVK